jgi:hypothetical protein
MKTEEVDANCTNFRELILNWLGGYSEAQIIAQLINGYNWQRL